MSPQYLSSIISQKTPRHNLLAPEAKQLALPRTCSASCPRCLRCLLPSKASAPSSCSSPTNTFRQLSNLHRNKGSHISKANALHRKSQELIQCARQAHSLEIIYRIMERCQSVIAEVCNVPGIRILEKLLTPKMLLCWTSRQDPKSVSYDNNWLSYMYSSHHISATKVVPKQSIILFYLVF